MRKIWEFMKEEYGFILSLVLVVFAVYGAYNFGILLFAIIEKISCNG